MKLKFNPKEKLYELLSLNDSSRHIALSFAIGVFISISPFLGFHTIAALLIAWIFRVNKVAIMVGTYTNNPWTFAPVYGLGLWIGMRLYGIDGEVPSINWGEFELNIIDLLFKPKVFFGLLTQLLAYLKPYLVPFVIGSLLLGLVVAVISYFAAEFAVQRYRKRKVAKNTTGTA